MTARLTDIRDDRVIRLPDIESDDHGARSALVGRRTVTYRELADTVDRLAARLRELGAAPGDRVVIWMAKGPEFAQAILAALQAGCAYVPVDGGHPAARLDAILSDTEPIALFTDARHLRLRTDPALPESVRSVVVVGEEHEVRPSIAHARDAPLSDNRTAVPTVTWAEFLGTPHDDAPLSAPPTDITPDGLAAILYTSGSTGAPKGVQISHRNLMAFIDWARRELAVGPDDVFANHASFNFDLSTFDLFVALSVGAAVWIVEDGEARDIAALAAGIREHRVTVWYSVPSILMLLTASCALTPEVIRSLRYVLFAGEVYPTPRLRELAAALADSVHPPVLYNLYGPTETNVCTFHRVTDTDLLTDDPVPIGLPVGNAELLIVDADGRRLETPDAVGELVVQGDCVTPGYWRRDSEPAAEQHRHGRHPTGDLVALVDGRLVYRGRKDRMVKLSGYRIELGEIESMVLRHLSIDAAAVVVLGTGAKARLALFYTVRAGAPEPTLIDIKEHCARHLPRYMVPRTVTRMTALPRNGNGKIDYRSFAEVPPTLARRRSSARRDEPRRGLS
ncbi:amino acid adenylation domain-containing protein [Nocardia sp. NPDC049149]|uniref:amino acid adenylation domain-containing protein n=1 Tax=Nocardia sp. NPDC049149 TaxID=3364315 RepID=UPI003711F36B